ncbi:RNA polymerase sigma factor [Pedobacter sp. SL55]|uniref:RNA polymerase sigma factor n=1 Tax=Pedobacter sp. SL55 TaxID=2995161 RepID=UPI00226ECA72|nr:sigma-70 family RNA polymerase sigma factor [Pedobacter sp. SL55]WAC40107.1 sigma-70 family RNA polymerase sigma factor [Pedobacter sp. SL55]
MNIGYSSYTLEELLLRIKEDDQRAFDELYSRTWKQLYIKTYSKLKIEDLSKDIVQEVFVDFWNKRHARDIQNVQAYLMQAVKFKVLDEFRKSRYEFVELDNFIEQIRDSNDADSQLISKEFFTALKAWTETLPAKRREIFKLKYEEGLSNKEIAERLDVSVKTVQNQLLNSSAELKLLLRTALFTHFLLFFGS